MTAATAAAIQIGCKSINYKEIALEEYNLIILKLGNLNENKNISKTQT